MRWTEQELQTLPLRAVFPVGRILVLDALARGERVGRASFDHNAPDYLGVGNKQIKMAAAQLSGDPGISMDEAWALFMLHAFGVEQTGLWP